MSTPTRFVAFGDNHGDMADDNAVEALVEFIKDYKPTVRVHLGDCFDFRSLRRGVGNDAEGAESLAADIAGGEDFLERTKPTVYLMGNHEHRAIALQHTSGSAIVRDYCADLEARIRTHRCPINDCHCKKRPFELAAHDPRLHLQLPPPSSVTNSQWSDNVESIGFPLQLF